MCVWSRFGVFFLSRCSSMQMENRPLLRELCALFVVVEQSEKVKRCRSAHLAFFSFFWSKRKITEKSRISNQSTYKLLMNISTRILNLQHLHSWNEFQFYLTNKTCLFWMFEWLMSNTDESTGNWNHLFCLYHENRN